MFLQKYIREEQMGFLPNRQIRYNLSTVLDSVEYYDKHPEKRYVFSLQTQKTLDNLIWEFMLLLMQKNAIWRRIYKGNRSDI